MDDVSETGEIFEKGYDEIRKVKLREKLYWAYSLNEAAKKDDSALRKMMKSFEVHELPNNTESRLFWQGVLLSRIFVEDNRNQFGFRFEISVFRQHEPIKPMVPVGATVSKQEEKEIEEANNRLRRFMVKGG